MSSQAESPATAGAELPERSPSPYGGGSLRRRTSDLVANVIRSQILSGELPAGEPLHQPQIAAELGVSRIPVREAIIGLDREGWVSIATNRRAYVSDLSTRDVADHYELRGLVFGLIAARAAVRARPADIEALAASTRQVEGAESADALASAHSAVLGCIVGLADSPRLHAALSVVPSIFTSDVEFFTVVAGALAAAETGVAEVLAGIEAGDPAGADAAMRNLLSAQGTLVVDALASLGVGTAEDGSTAPAIRRGARSSGGEGADAVAAHIRELIMGGDLVEGDRLPQDDIAARVGVSRIPVREAIIALEREGWLRVEPHRGAFVLRFDDAAILDHYELYGRYFAFAARKAIERMSPDESTNLEEIVGQLAQVQAPDAVEDLTNRYLETLVQCAHSRRLRVALRSMVPMIGTKYFSTVPGAIEAEKRGLAQLWEAIGDCDPVAAEHAVTNMSREQARNASGLLLGQ